MSNIKLLQIEPTSKCNFHCGFCCGRSMDQSNISLDLFKEILDRFPFTHHIEIQGEGEPLLHPELFEMIHYANSKRIKVSLITNGSLLTKNNNIEKILSCNISSIRISLESAEPNDFYRIRGGKLDEVIKGVEALILRRFERKQQFPSIGFSVTLLKSMREKFLGILDLYLSLEMDGGISVHMLNLMEDYTNVYNDELFDEILSENEKKIFWDGFYNNKAVQSIQTNKSRIAHFYNELFPSRKGINVRTERTFRGCPWLDKALYINRHGIATVCANVKDTNKFSLGKIPEDSIEKIIGKRSAISKTLRSGDIPPSCKKCRIAESISSRLHQFLDKKILITKGQVSISNELKNNSPKANVTGTMTFSDSILEKLLKYSNGQKLISDIVEEICFCTNSSSETIRAEVLPLIDELVLRNLAFIVD